MFNVWACGGAREMSMHVGSGLAPRRLIAGSVYGIPGPVAPEKPGREASPGRFGPMHYGDLTLELPSLDAAHLCLTLLLFPRCRKHGRPASLTASMENGGTDSAAAVG